MTRLEHTIDIERPLTDVVKLAKQVEKYPEFLPGYLESRIVEKKEDAVLLERKAVVKGKLHTWRSWVRFPNEEHIEFEHAAGPLKGMQIVWSFSSLTPFQTRLQIVHHVKVPRAWPLGWFLEKTYYAPGVNQMANGVVKDFKLACERGGQAS
jgi:ribosome-associated toxin RatA of RatAB toxin-antitoxin module